MTKYIELEALKNRFAKRLDWLKKDIHDEYSLGLYDGCEYDTKLIDEIPAADVVPVVRCRDCKFGDWDSEPDDAMVCMRTKDGFWRSGNDFCSYGERKERC